MPAETKEFIKKSDIRTMGKDLKMAKKKKSGHFFKKPVETVKPGAMFYAAQKQGAPKFEEMKIKTELLKTAEISKIKIMEPSAPKTETPKVPDIDIKKAEQPKITETKQAAEVKIPEKKITAEEIIPAKNSFQPAPKTAKISGKMPQEKLQPAKIKDEKKRKFMEDVERWASYRPAD